MATGTVASSLEAVHLSGLNSRITDRSAQLFTPFKLQAGHVEDVGYVTANRYVQAYLWNGSQEELTLEALTEVETTGNVLEGISETDSILSQSSAYLLVTVTKYGNLEFTAVYTFDFGCPTSQVLTITGTRPLLSTEQPVPISVDDAMAEAYAYADCSDTYYDTLEFSSEGTNETVMVVYSDQDLETPQGTYLACKFDCRLPTTEGAVRGQMEISVEFLPKDAQTWLLDMCKSRSKMAVRWRQYLGANQEPDAELHIPLDIVSVEITAAGATATALFPDLVNMPFPRKIMTTKNLPGGIN